MLFAQCIVKFKVLTINVKYENLSEYIENENSLSERIAVNRR